MFFHQDDFGLLIALKLSSLWQFVFTPQAEHFSPIILFVWAMLFKIFGLQFWPFLGFNLIVHVLNCLLLAKIVGNLTKNNYLKYIAAAVFLVNFNYTGTFLSLNCTPPAVSFLGVAFFFWYKLIKDKSGKYFWYSLSAIILSGFSCGIGSGVGLVFALTTGILIIVTRYTKSDLRFAGLIYFLAGIMSYAIGPLISPKHAGAFIPKIANPLKDLALYLAFIISGVGRGVVGRLFLPGFEPRHTEVAATIVSFAPFVLIVGALIWVISKELRIKKKNIADAFILIPVSIFVIYPYVWSGFLRYQFGLKQALAERYVYPSLFFFVILFCLLINYVLGKKLISRLVITIGIIILVVMQSLILYRNSLIYEERPIKEKQYFLTVSKILPQDFVFVDLPLPSYINQDYFTLKDFAVLVDNKRHPKFIKPRDFCTPALKETLKNTEILYFYEEQARDPTVAKVFDKNKLEECLK